MLVHLDGFDSYSVAADLSQEYTSTMTFSTSAGRFGGGAMTNAGTTYFTKPLAAPTTELWFGFACKFSGISTYDNIMSVSSAAGNEVTICAPASVGFILRAGSRTGAVIASSSSPSNFYASMWHWFECRYKYGASVGVFEVWCDGVQYLSFTGNTTSAGGGTITSVQFAANGGGPVGNIDDFYIIDVAAGGANTTRLGDCRVGTLVPTSNASPNQATPSTGSAYTCVDEAQWNTTDYVTFTSYSAGLQELYGMSSLPSTPSGIFGVKVLAIGDKSDAGSAGFYPMVKSAGSSALATGYPLSTSWGRVSGIFETNPNTSAAWLTAAVNAMACGVQTV